MIRALGFSRANRRARWIATTVLPVPAPPERRNAPKQSVQIRRRIRLDIEDVVEEFERGGAVPDDLSGGGKYRPHLGVVGELGKVTGAARHGVVDQQSPPIGCAQCIADGGHSEMWRHVQQHALGFVDEGQSGR